MYNSNQPWWFHWPLHMGLRLHELGLDVLEVEDMYDAPETVRDASMAGSAIDAIGRTVSGRFVWLTVQPKATDRSLTVTGIDELTRAEFEELVS
jgi:hypothetical protein